MAICRCRLLPDGIQRCRNPRCGASSGFRPAGIGQPSGIESAKPRRKIHYLADSQRQPADQLSGGHGAYRQTGQHAAAGFPICAETKPSISAGNADSGRRICESTSRRSRENVTDDGTQQIAERDAGWQNHHDCTAHFPRIRHSRICRFDGQSQQPIQLGAVGDLVSFGLYRHAARLQYRLRCRIAAAETGQNAETTRAGAGRYRAA